jgi:nitrite reductase (NO-forming)
MNEIIISSLVVGLLIAGFVYTAVFTIHSPSEAQASHRPCMTKHVLLIANETRVKIVDPGNDLYPDPTPPPDGISYNAMTWNNTIPGPVISVDQCDDLKVTVMNVGTVVHSLDFHAGNGPSNAIGVSGPGGSSTIAPGASKTWTLHADIPGFFMYHCAGNKFNGIWEHIGSGMYGGIVVHPHDEPPAKEFYVVFGEIYSNSTTGGTTGSFDINKFKADNPDFVLTNGMSHRYVQSIGDVPELIHLTPGTYTPAEVFKVRPYELTRWYIVNAGPNDDVAFHFISAMIDVHDGFLGSGGGFPGSTGRLDTQLRSDETWSIPAGSGSVIESIFPEEGIYVGVDHSMKDVLKGGAFIVKATSTSTGTDHPIGTWVPPKGSPIAAGHPFLAPDP